MTLYATRESKDGKVSVSMTYGPIQAKVIEDAGHVGSFWAQLGRLLAENPQHRERQAQNAYDRYRAHANGVSVNGDPLPAWDEQAEEIREHWREAFAPVS